MNDNFPLLADADAVVDALRRYIDGGPASGMSRLDPHRMRRRRSAKAVEAWRIAKVKADG